MWSSLVLLASRGHAFARCLLASVVAAAILATFVGCAETQRRGHEITRHAALRGVDHRPQTPTTALPVIVASVEAATEDEIDALQRAAKAAFEAELAENPDAPVAEGNADLSRCRLRVIVKRQSTFYVARCRARWVLREVTLAAVDVEVKRRVRSQALTEDEAKAVQANTRSPVMVASEATAAIRDAAELAARILRDPQARIPLLNEDADNARQQTLAARPHLRTLALEGLTNKNAARRATSAIDLVTLGQPGDGAVLVPLLDDPDETVRIGAAVALVELASAAEAEALFRHRNHPHPLVRKHIARALDRVLALNPSLVVPPLGPPPQIAPAASSNPPTGIEVQVQRRARKVISLDDDTNDDDTNDDTLDDETNEDATTNGQTDAIVPRNEDPGPSNAEAVTPSEGVTAPTSSSTGSPSN